MSPEEVQPINGSMARGCSGSYSSRHSWVWARPDCIAFLAGLKMRAVMEGGIPLRNDIEALGGNVQDGIDGIRADDSLPECYPLTTGIVTMPRCDNLIA